MTPGALEAWSPDYFAVQNSNETDLKRVAPVGKTQLSNGSYLIQVPTISWKGGRLTLQNYSLKRIIESAWDVKNYQILGPAWLDSDAFQIVAKAQPNTTEEQARLMCQSLLADRFGLILHREQREFPVYVLVPGKGSPKLNRKRPGSDSGKNGEDVPDKIVAAKLSAGHLESPRASIAWLAEALTKRLGKPVVDKTGIKGEFYLSLDWTPDPGDPPLYPGAKMPPPGFTSENNFGPSIFTAIQEQLGLKLETGKEMVDVLVIDHVERVPNDN